MRTRVIVLSATAGMVMALSGCSSANPGAKLATTSSEQWTNKVQVVGHPDSIRLGIHADGPSANQEAAISDFVLRWMQADGGTIDVQAPSGASPRMIAGVYQMLTEQGAPAASVKLSSYDPGPEPGAPIVVGFERFETIAPKCGLNWENLTRTSDNETFANFGCAVTANMAAQVANPEDLIRPRAMTPADAQRRATVLDKYRQGAVTSSATDAQASGTISKAVN
jgi:pilus assembly protein CpaD